MAYPFFLKVIFVIATVVVLLGIRTLRGFPSLTQLRLNEGRERTGLDTFVWTMTFDLFVVAADDVTMFCLFVCLCLSLFMRLLLLLLFTQLFTTVGFRVAFD